MVRLLLFLAALTAPWTAQAALTPTNPFPDTRIRVRLTEGISVADIRGYDLRVYAGGSHKVATVINRESSWELRCEDGRIRARETAGEELGERSLALPEPVVIKSPAGFIQFHGKPYREDLMIYSVGSLCEVVNEIDLEKYLEGLVNAEFSSRWNEEAIGAQVVAARTYALYQIRQARLAKEDQHFDVDSSTYDQVYAGSIKEDSRAARIVEKTRGWVLTVKGKKGVEPLKAYYSSTCGGMTELPHEVWGTSDVGFRRVNCPFCAHSPSAHWSFDLSSRQVADALRRAGRRGATDFSSPTGKFPRDWKRILDKGQLRAIRIVKYDPSGRVEQIVLSFSLGGQMGEKIRDWPMSGARFREWMGATQFKSTSFQLQLASSADGRQLVWKFLGRGNGHGVGLCQWGAKTMGERGYKTAAILKYYYPDAQLRKLW